MFVCRKVPYGAAFLRFSSVLGVKPCMHFHWWLAYLVPYPFYVICFFVSQWLLGDRSARWQLSLWSSHSEVPTLQLALQHHTLLITSVSENIQWNCDLRILFYDMMLHHWMIISWCFWTWGVWRWRHYGLSECWELLTEHYGITWHKNGMFNYTTVKTSKLYILLSIWGHNIYEQIIKTLS